MSQYPNIKLLGYSTLQRYHLSLKLVNRNGTGQCKIEFTYRSVKMVPG